MIAVKLSHVSKCYTVYGSPLQSLAGMVAPRMVAPRQVWALRDVDLEIEAGACVGIVGDNGSGKSTLLAIIGGIIEATAGERQVQGAVSTLLDLTVGVQPELTGRDNVAIIGGILGLSRAEMEQRAPAILAFAELGDAVDRPVKTYSTGMTMRLGFAIGLHADFDVFLVDEVLAVGDANFQRKCINRMRDLNRQDGRTLVVASHALGEIGALADRLLLLDQGRVARDGPTEEVLAAYWSECERQRNRIGRRVDPLKSVNPYGDDLGDVIIERVRFVDSAGRDIDEVRTGEPMTVEIWFDARRKVVNPLFRVQIFRNDGVWVHGMNTYRHGCDLGELEGRGCIRLEYERIVLLEADYYVSVGVWPDEYTSFLTDVAFDYREKAYRIRVASDREHGAGVCSQPARWSVSLPGRPETAALLAALEREGPAPPPAGRDDPAPGEAEPLAAVALAPRARARDGDL